MNNRETIAELRKWLYGKRTYTAIPERIELFEDTVKGLQVLFESEGVHVDIRIEHPEIPLGDMFIFIEATHPIIHNTERLAELISRLKNIELYPLPDGKIHLGCRFADVYKVSVSESIQKA